MVRYLTWHFINEFMNWLIKHHNQSRTNDIWSPDWQVIKHTLICFSCFPQNAPSTKQRFMCISSAVTAHQQILSCNSLEMIHWYSAQSLYCIFRELQLLQQVASVSISQGWLKKKKKPSTEALGRMSKVKPPSHFGKQEETSELIFTSSQGQPCDSSDIKGCYW